MVVRQPRYSQDEFAPQGDRGYETQIRQKAGNDSKIVAIDIDIETGNFEVGETVMFATDRTI